MDATRLSLSENKTFALLVVMVTLAFALILWPFWVPVFWAAVLAVVFSPVYRMLLHAMRDRRSMAAAAATLLIVLMVILPATLVGAVLSREAGDLYDRIQTGELDLAALTRTAFAAVPDWVEAMLLDAGFGTFGDLQSRFAATFDKVAKLLASEALSIGQNTIQFVVSFFVMLYLLFFFLRDGRWLAARINAAIPLEESLRRRLGSRFITVVRATVKGNVVVAALQGALGGIAFWVLDIRAAFLWGVLMGLFSLLPAVGSAIVWLPVAIYLLLTEATWQGAGLIAYGVLVIGLVDNFLRPLLVGKDTRMPDYVVLVATLGGMAIFGLNGFVIGPLVAAMFIAVWDTVSAARADDAAGP